MNMEGKRELSVVIDGKVYRLSGGSDSYLQKLASYVDGKISELKTQAGYNKLSTEYRDILLALTIAEDVFKLKEEIEVFNQDSRDREQELYELKQEVVDKKLQIDTANKLVEDYKTKVNELQKRMIGLETNHEFREEREPAGITCSGRFFRTFKGSGIRRSRCNLYGRREIWCQSLRTEFFQRRYDRGIANCAFS